MSLEILQLIVSIGALLVAAVGVPLLYYQLRGVRRTIYSTTHAAIYEQAADFRAHLVEYPHLRKYFFDGVEITPEHDDYERVVTLAELYLNYVEHIAVLGDRLGGENRPSLERFSRVALDKSPILRQHLSDNNAAYSDTLNRFIDN